MATLLDRLKKNRSTVKTGSGPLQETSKEELQSLAQQSGMPSTPSTPLSAEGIGATSDQAKMLGTPAQQQGAVRMQVREQDQLSTAQRQEQARKQSTAEEQATQSRALQFEGLGSLGDRVQQIATGMLNQTAQGQGAIAQARKANTEVVGQYIAPGADIAQTVDLLNKLGSNTVTNQEMVQLATNLGITDVSDMAKLKNEISNQFLSQEEQLGQFTAGQIADNVSVSQLTGPQLEQLGFGSIEDFAAALQVDPQTLQGMTLRQLQDQFGKERLEDFGKAQAAQAVIADPNASRAMKEQALKELRELGATGVRAAESDVRKIEEQVQNASTVQFGGEEYSVEDLLKDDTIKGMVKTYLTDPEEAKLLKQKEPQFAQWIEDNKKVLAAASADVDARQEQFAKIQLDNMQIGNTDVGSLSADALKSFIPDYGKIRAEKYQEPAFLKMVKNKEIPESTAAQMIGAMNTLAEIDPSYVESMAGLTADEIGALGLNTEEGVRRYRQYVQDATDLINTPDEEVVQRLTGGLYDDSALSNLVIDNDAMNAFGIGGVSDKGMTLLSAWSGGDNEALKNKFLEMSGGLGATGKPKTVREMLETNTRPTGFQSGSEILSGTASAIAAKAKSNDLFRKFGHLWKGDNQLTPNEAAQLGMQVEKASNPIEYNSLDALRNTANIAPAAQRELNYYLRIAGNRIAQNQANQAGQFGSDEQYSAAINKANAGELDDAGKAQLNTTLSQLSGIIKSPDMQGVDVQNGIRDRISQVTSAIGNQAAKDLQRAINAQNAADAKKALDQIKNFAQVIKYGSVPSLVAIDGYIALDAAMQQNFGFGLPGVSGVKDIDAKIDAVTQDIATRGKEAFTNPQSLRKYTTPQGVGEATSSMMDKATGGRKIKI